jgi:pyrimidine operon attenuation protein/uracil phosphoribosyltransferase
MPYPKQLLTGTAVNRALDRIAHQIAERNENGNQVVVVGIQKGGVHLANRLQGSRKNLAP